MSQLEKFLTTYYFNCLKIVVFVTGNVATLGPLELNSYVLVELYDVYFLIIPLEA